MTSSVLHVRLFGTFDLALNDSPVQGINTSRLQSLLAFLILRADAPQSRQHAAFLLWPDSDEAHARSNLRQFLHQLRQVLPDADRYLESNSNVLYWKLDAAQDIDVRLFELALNQAAQAERRGDGGAARQALARAVALYRGELVPSCYDEWITPERERLSGECRVAYQKLAHALEEERDYPAALQAAESLLRLDPLDETSYVTLIRLHLLNEDRANAERVYRTGLETLSRELGVEPGEMLRDAYARLQAAPRTGLASGAADASSGASLTLIGRNDDWQELRAAWQRAVKGEPNLALITGEPGIGKSRLAEELYDWAVRQGFAAAHTRSYAAEGRLALAPVADWLRSPALSPRLASLNPLWLTEIARVLPELLAERNDLVQPEPINEYGARLRFFQALARAVLAAPQPLLLWIDDLQWCDPETLEWLHFLIRFDPHSKVLILATARSRESPPDQALANWTRQLQSEDKLLLLELDPLDAAETAKLAAAVSGREPDTSTALRLYRETEGNPLFVVETVRAGMGDIPPVAEGVPTLEPRALPPRVYAVIAGRLAQLSPDARRVAEVGAAIGRAFTLDVLLRTEQADENRVTAALAELWHKRIVREQSANVFDFTHDKLREVAYAEISAPQRRLLHRRIAHALEALYAEQLDPVSAQIAAQYEQAGLIEQAVPYYQRAGNLAASVYANDDAIALLTRGLALLAQLPPGEKRDRQELSFALALVPLYRITTGWAAPETERAANRAYLLSMTAGTVAQRLQALWLRQTVDVVAGRFDEVTKADAQMQGLLATPGAPPLPFFRIHYAGTLSLQGHFVNAYEIFEQMLGDGTEKFAPELFSPTGVNYWAHGAVWESHALWCLGYPRRAMERCQAGMRAARAFEQPFNHALTITYLAMLEELSADPRTFFETVRAAEALSREFKVRYYHAWATILLRFARAWQEPNRENLAQLRDAIDDLRRDGTRIRLPYYVSLLARAYQQAGRLDDALGALHQASAESEQRHEHWWDAELLRLRGELLWAQGAAIEQVETAFGRALEISRSQQARSLELRAASSMARLWQASGRAADARELLTPLYGWFSEGLDTPDLQTAQSLLAEL